jgi:hypothetical protein
MPSFFFLPKKRGWQRVTVLFFSYLKTKPLTPDTQPAACRIPKAMGYFRRKLI